MALSAYKGFTETYLGSDGSGIIPGPRAIEEIICSAFVADYLSCAAMSFSIHIHAPSYFSPSFPPHPIVQDR